MASEADREESARTKHLPAQVGTGQNLVFREKCQGETGGPVLTNEERALVAELVADGLSIQEKFWPEPLYKNTGKCHFESDTVEENKRAKEGSRGKPQS